MDFVTGLPIVGKYDYNAVLVVSCRYSRAIVLCPTTKDADAEQTARVFVQHALVVSGLPRVIISDRDPKFTSDFWQTLHARLGTKLSMSTAHHPQTDGLAERQIGSFEEALRAFCGFGFDADDLKDEQVNWVDLLPALAFAYNSSVHASTKQAPYMLERGYIPRGVLDALADSLPLKKVNPCSNATIYSDLLDLTARRAKDALRVAFEYSKG
jgi:transposase InsO family protein